MTLTKNITLMEFLVDVKGRQKLNDLSRSTRELNEAGTGLNQSTEKGTKNQRESNIATREGTRNSRDLLMGHLGIMFAGMALNRAMTSLTQTSRDWVGMGEIMSTTMGVVMLPATMDLLENGLIPLSSWFLDLPEPAQEAIGQVTFALQGLGGALMVGGQLALGLNSMKILWPNAFALMTTSVFTLAGALTILGTAFLALAIWSFVDGLAEASEKYNALGEDIRSTNEIIGQYGKGTREMTAPKASADVQRIMDDITTESLGFTGPTTSRGLDLRPVSDFGIDLSRIDREMAFANNEFGTPSTEGPSIVNIYQTNNVEVGDINKYLELIEDNNYKLIQEIRS